MQINKQAFTLIELLVVVLIIGILAAVAVPQYQKAVLKSRYVQAKTLARTIANAEEVFYASNGTYTSHYEELDVNIPTPIRDIYCYEEGCYADYIWGTCVLGDRSVTCNVNVGLGYVSSFKRSFWAGEQWCIARGALNISVCKMETNQTGDGIAWSKDAKSRGYRYK